MSAAPFESRQTTLDLGETIFDLGGRVAAEHALSDDRLTLAVEPLGEVGVVVIDFAVETLDSRIERPDRFANLPEQVERVVLGFGHGSVSRAVVVR